MAFITKQADGNTPCYSCGKQCINVEFCNEGDSDEIKGYSLSRNIRVSIIANPEFWGFEGVLISGWATYSNGFYDFFDGHDEDHTASKTCYIGSNSTITTGPFKNEQRPDVLFRSVYDPDTGITTHYGSNGTLEGYGIGRGGAEVNLINRTKGLVAPVTSDKKSCDLDDPTEVFKFFPENFGWGNKINFNTKIYKNLTGAWRLSSIDNCYEGEDLYTPAGYLIDCSGNPKQNISYEEKRYQNYEPSQKRGSGDSNYYLYNSGCRPDGAIAGKYSGFFTNSNSIYRTPSSDFIRMRLSYGPVDNPGPAYALKNGMEIGIKNDVYTDINGIYTIFDVVHFLEYSVVNLVGTSSSNDPVNGVVPTGSFYVDIGTSGHWIAFGTYDPETCCGLNAYGVSDVNDKRLKSVRNYHSDFRRVYNNPKNIHQSNRDPAWRENYDLFSSIPTVSTGVRIDHTYPSASGIENSQISSGYPILNSGQSLVISGTGASYLSGVSPLYERELSYYGPFYDVERYDDAIRLNSKSNKGIAKNGTCYSKSATLEIFPDCITQYDRYEECDTARELYVTNRLPRLAFVYRGCDFHDECSFDDNKRPLGGWKNQGSIPTGIDDLKRQLAGQEIHMFINLGTALGGRKPGTPCPCDDSEDPPIGEKPPEHVKVGSPMTFPSFPNFDLNPSGYGCYDERYQAVTYNQLEATGTASNDCNGVCDPIPSSTYACLPRQPYVTYGYMMNLCGKEDRNRKDVIIEAFSKLHQSKTYTNINSGENIDEPMYWNVIAPPPLPADSSGIWSSGTEPRDGGNNGFIQYAGSGYGYWGLADSNQQVVAPYFCAKKNEFRCYPSDAFVEYIDFDIYGTHQNVLNTHNGWPTDKVPFLIELEVDDSCLGCVTTNMKNVNLNLELQGLHGDFIWDETDPDEADGFRRYGHNYCRYGSGPKGKIEGLDFTCTDGFDTVLCDGDSLKGKYASYYNESTCGCIDDMNITLYPVVINKTEDMVIGWTSNPGGDGAGLIDLTGCKDLLSSYLDVDRGDESTANGYRIFAEFNLACNGNHTYLDPAECPDIIYGSSPVHSLWGNPDGCSHHYPARIGQNGGDIELQTTLYMVSEPRVNILKAMTAKALREKSFTECIGPSDFYPNSTFGICEGETVYGYGCRLSNGEIYGCETESIYSTDHPCYGNTPCNTCPTGVGSGDVTCICDSPVGYEGIIPRALPPEYNLNSCYCQCKDPELVAEYVASGNTLVKVSGECPTAVIYWMGTDNISPILISCLPPNPYIGLKLGTVSSTDYFDWSHGINALVSGVRYELNKPFLGEPGVESTTNCEQLLKTQGISTNGSIIDCAYTGCAANIGVGNSTCGNPIYSSGDFPDGDVVVRKKKCHPEIAIVSKIECLPGTGYKLYISREYHEHDRTWYEEIVVGEGDNTESICVPVNMGAYRYNDGSNSGCQNIPYSLLADAITPVGNPPCSINPSSGEYVTQDYRYSNSSFPSGSPVWNYFNLFYSSGYLPPVAHGSLEPSIGRDESGIFDCDLADLAIQNTGTIFTSGDYIFPIGFNGIFATTGIHSCVQDATSCGGDLWCNKLFFPRHNYQVGTRIAPFGAPSVCTSNSDFEPAFGLDGYDEYEQIPAAKDIFSEQSLRFVDWCNDDAVEELLEPLDIDGNYIVVEDYLPLMGIKHPGFKYTSDTKSCTVVESGCVENIPTHSDITIDGGLHYPKTYTANFFDSMGYYLDKFGNSYDGQGGLIKATKDDECLFNPFKIFIDVECSTNTIARKHVSTDLPTFLQGVQEWPASSCQGMIGTPQCSCSSTKCRFNSLETRGECIKLVLAGYEMNGCGQPTTTTKWFHPDVLSPYDGEPCQYMQQGEDWRVNNCDGVFYQIVAETYITRWQCSENQYIYPNPGTTVNNTLCDCESNTLNGLCSAIAGCSDFSSCDCNPIYATGVLYNPVPSPDNVGGGNSLWWEEDCGCAGFPLQENPCQDAKSLVHWQITEAD